jgi:ABC-2 type transport system permease protein
MMKSLTKAFAFFTKEFHDIRRQPRLLISLVGGPLLVLAAFGATFRSANPYVTSVLVWPKDGVPGISQEEAVNIIGSNFPLIKVTTDEAEAMQMLESGEVDVVQIVPELPTTQQAGLPRPEIQVLSKTIDPNAEAWIRSLAYAETNYINQRLLTSEAVQAQARAQEVMISLQDFHTQLAQLGALLTPETIERTGTVIVALRSLLEGLLAALPAEGSAQANLAPELSAVRTITMSLLDELSGLEQALQGGNVAAQIERLNGTLDKIGDLRVTIRVLVDTPAEDIIAPIKQSYTNLRGSPYSLVVFYAPAVLALLVQQLAITLASLGVVRERQMGAFEMFRVSPLGLSQILFGKALAYTLFATIAGIVLRALMTLLTVPFPAYPLQYLALLVMLSVASVGIGMLISAASRTDAQAIQLTMLILLLSVFFTGFFLPMNGFALPARIIGLLIPMTHAMKGFRELSLSGTALDSGVWVGLALITLLSYGTVALVMRRQYRRVMD